MDARLRIFVGGVFDYHCRNWSILAASSAEKRCVRIEDRGTRGASAVTRRAEAADLVEQAVHETLTYYGFPDIHWQKIRTNNPLERIMKEIRRRTRVVGAFPDGQSCLNLAAARLRHIAGTTWSAVLHEYTSSPASDRKASHQPVLDRRGWYACRRDRCGNSGGDSHLMVLKPRDQLNTRCCKSMCHCQSALWRARS